MWEVHLTADAEVDGVVVRRNTRTAFQVAVPTARFNGDVDINANRDSVFASLGVDVAEAGRYEARAILFATDKAGEMRPVSVAHQATVIEAGNGILELEFDFASIEAAGLAAPYELRDLRLIHQNSMSILHRQKSAVKF